MDVHIENFAPPIVRIVAAMARRSLRDPDVAKRLSKLAGTVVLQSATDPQAVTMRFAAGALHIEAGAYAEADVTIVADLADPDAKPKVSGAAGHPRLALGVAKLLEPPVRSWRDEADEFWTRALIADGCPRPIRVVCTDDASEQRWGGDNEPRVEIHGDADALAKAFSGDSVLVEAVLAGKLYLVGDLRDISVITGSSIDRLFGEL